MMGMSIKFELELGSGGPLVYRFALSCKGDVWNGAMKHRTVYFAAPCNVIMGSIATVLQEMNPIPHKKGITTYQSPSDLSNSLAFGPSGCTTV